MSTYDFEPDPSDYGPEPAHIANGRRMITHTAQKPVTYTPGFVQPLYEPKRREDRVEELTEQLAFQLKVNNGLLATIDRLEGEIAKVREESNRVLLAALGSLRK